MVLVDNGDGSSEIEQPNGAVINGHVPLHMSSSQRGLISDENSQIRSHKTLIALVNRIRFFKLGSLASQRGGISCATPSSSSHALRKHFNQILSRKINRASLWNLWKQWIRDPMNMALFLWIICVAVSGAILFLVMTGMLNHALPRKSQQDAWFEINNQILNALFTLMCLYQHPRRFYHLVLLLRWKPDDISNLRKSYCKNGTSKPHEWTHMMVVVAMLHINCFAQYALCGLNWGYRRSERSAIGVGICISVAITAPAVAGVYAVISPLGRDYDIELDEEAQDQVAASETIGLAELRQKLPEKKYSFASRDKETTIEKSPMWDGGIFDFWDDIYVGCLSLFCSCCVFGWNMQRLGLGNMYVHIATFLLFCTAPFWIFILAAIHIDNNAVREALRLSGFSLCVFGLFYGGFWRIQMRKKFNLPPYNFCCDRPSVTDCALWLCCCWCSLSQEVRTGNSYYVIEDQFHSKEVGESVHLSMSPLPREQRKPPFRSGPSSPLANSFSPSSTAKADDNAPSSSRFLKYHSSPDRQLSSVDERVYTKGKDETMAPPSPSIILRQAI